MATTNTKSKINQVNYKEAFFDTVASLAQINKQIIFNNVVDKKGNKIGVNIKNNDDSQTVLYEINAPTEMFDFVGTSMAMIDFPKFVQYYNTYVTKEKSPLIYTEDGQNDFPIFLHIKSPEFQSEIKHRLGDVDCVKKSCFEDGIEQGDNDADVDFTESEFAQLKKMIAMIDATNIAFTVKEDICHIKLYNPKALDIFERDYPMKITTKEEFSLSIPINGFAKIPTAAYNMNIDNEGLIHLHQTRDDALNLDIYLPFDA